MDPPSPAGSLPSQKGSKELTHSLQKDLWSSNANGAYGAEPLVDPRVPVEVRHPPRSHSMSVGCRSEKPKKSYEEVHGKA